MYSVYWRDKTVRTYGNTWEESKKLTLRHPAIALGISLNVHPPKPSESGLGSARLSYIDDGGADLDVLSFKNSIFCENVSTCPKPNQRLPRLRISSHKVFEIVLQGMETIPGPGLFGLRVGIPNLSPEEKRFLSEANSKLMQDVVCLTFAKRKLLLNNRVVFVLRTPFWAQSRRKRKGRNLWPKAIRYSILGVGVIIRRVFYSAASIIHLHVFAHIQEHRSVGDKCFDQCSEALPTLLQANLLI
jgi:hypothetical protein